MENPPRRDRLAELFRRLSAAPPAASHDEMYRQLFDTLNGVEDDLTDIPYDPDKWEHDDRLYPPFPDRARPVPDRPDLIRYANRAHNTFIAVNGAIEIRLREGDVVVFAKPGADGRPVW